MGEISLDQNELSEIVAELKTAGTRFGKTALSMNGRRSTISAVDLLSETFAKLQDGFEASGEAIVKMAAVLSGSGEVLIEEDTAAAGRFK